MYREREIQALMEYEESQLVPKHVREQRFEARGQPKPENWKNHNSHFCVSLRELLKPGVFEELCRRFS